MKKICIGLFLTVCIFSQAQIFKTVQIQKFSTGESTDVKLSGISPKGSFVLTTTGTNKGLQKVSLASHEVEKISDAQGAGFQPAISADEQNVLFREVSYTPDEHLRMTAFKNHSTLSKTQEELQKPQREVKAYGFRQNEPYVQDQEGTGSVRLRSKGVKVAEPVGTSVFTQDLQLMVNKDGQTVQLSPNGTQESYIWPSLSPDGTKILYYVSGEGAYVCNLDGTGVQFIHHDCRAPQWYDNNTIIGMNDTDDGEVVTSSQIVAYTLTGEKQALTEPQSFTMYPYASQEAGIVACSDIYGEINIIRLTK